MQGPVATASEEYVKEQQQEGGGVVVVVFRRLVPLHPSGLVTPSLDWEEQELHPACLCRDPLRGPRRPSKGCFLAHCAQHLDRPRSAVRSLLSPCPPAPAPTPSLDWEEQE